MILRARTNDNQCIVIQIKILLIGDNTIKTFNVLTHFFSNKRDKMKDKEKDRDIWDGFDGWKERKLKK